MSARTKLGLTFVVIGASVIGPAGAAGASDAPNPAPAEDCVVRVQGVQGATQVCQGTFVDDNDGDGKPDPGGESHAYACAGVEGRGACAWTVQGSAVPGVGVGACAYAYNDTNPAAPRTPTQCANDGHGCLVNGNQELPMQCDPD